MVFMTRPLGQIVTNIENPLTIENMTGWFECFGCLGIRSKIKQGGESEPHSAPFVCNKGPAYFAADLAGQDTIIPAKLAVKKT